MGTWFSPFPLASSLEAALSSIRFVCRDLNHGKEVNGWKDAPALWIYDRPDQVILHSRDRNRDPISAEYLLLGYTRILPLPDGCRLISAWRLTALIQNPRSLVNWLSGSGSPCPTCMVQPPAIKPVLALLLGRLTNESPRILEAYLKAEAASERAGTEPDLSYAEILERSYEDTKSLIIDWWNDALQTREQAAIRRQLLDSQARHRELMKNYKAVSSKLSTTQLELDFWFRRASENSTSCNELNNRISYLETNNQELREKVQAEESSRLEIEQSLDSNVARNEHLMKQHAEASALVEELRISRFKLFELLKRYQAMLSKAVLFA